MNYSMPGRNTQVAGSEMIPCLCMSPVRVQLTSSCSGENVIRVDSF